MITEIEVRTAFQLALLLTGSIEAAECAVSHTIAASGCGVTGDQLQMATAKEAIQIRDDFSPQAEALSILPLELQRLFQLSTVGRDVFVLRMLMGLSPEMSAGILSWHAKEIDAALCLALNDLPRLVCAKRVAAVSP